MDMEPRKSQLLGAVRQASDIAVRSASLQRWPAVAVRPFLRHEKATRARLNREARIINPPQKETAFANRDDGSALAAS
jgi:hypothetical protein